MIEDVRAFVKALPARLAAVQAVLLVVAVEVVPLLPGPVAARVGAWIAVAAGWLVAIARVVTRVTEVPGSARGFTVPDRTELVVEHRWLTGDRDPISGVVVR